jgi:hypothetical protein
MGMELDERKKQIDAQRAAQIKELILSLIHRNKDSDSVLSALSNIKPNHISVFENAQERISACRQILSSFCDLSFYKADFLTVDKKETEKIGILDNNYIREVFERLSEKKSLSPVFFSSFDEICENINSGNCAYGILPTESTESGKLLRFYHLMDEYDLKINAACDISYADDSAATRYSLVSKNIILQSSCFGPPDCLEFTINPENIQSLNEILYAASLCSLELQRIDSIPIPYKENEFSFCPVFKIKNSEIDTFLLYMYLDFPQYTPIGVFPIL